MSDPAQHEQSDFPVRPIAITVASLLLGLVVISVGMEFVYHFKRTPLTAGESLANGANYRTSIENDRSELTERFRKNLAAPHWIDRETGIVAIPVDDAIDRIAADGKLPTWPPSDIPPVPRNRPEPVQERSSQ